VEKARSIEIEGLGEDFRRHHASPVLKPNDIDF
jgi:hypothetical protein